MNSLRLSLLALLPVLCAAEEPIEPTYKIAVVKTGGFCSNGVYSVMHWDKGSAPKGLAIYGSFCSKGDNDVGRLETEVFIAPQSLNLYLAGYAGLPGRRLLLKDAQTGAETELKPPMQPGEVWRYFRLTLPFGWQGKAVRLVAVDEAKGRLGWLGFGVPDLPLSSFVTTSLDTSVAQSGFCRDGAYGSTRWPVGGRPVGTEAWGSFCKTFDAGTGWFASPPVKAGLAIRLYLAGYPDTKGLTMALENVRTHAQFPLRVPKAPGESWKLYQYTLPEDWKGQQVRVIARDEATGMQGWLSFSSPVAAETGRDPLTGEAVAWLLAILLGPGLAALVIARFRGSQQWRWSAGATLLVFAMAFGIYVTGPLWMPTEGTVAAASGALLGAATVAYLVRRSRSTVPLTAAERNRWAALPALWIFGLLAVIPIVLQWPAPPPSHDAGSYPLMGLAYLAAAGICYAIFRVERLRLDGRQAMVLVFLVVLLSGIVNNIHGFNVDKSSNYVQQGNRVWQAQIHDQVVQLSVQAIPHSYRFLPNSIVRWMELAGVDYDTARDLYRMVVGLLLFYAIYRYARLFCSFTGAAMAMLFSAAIYPVSFEYYAGQLTDPLSHLSFVVALILLETGEFALLVSTLVIGSLAKETVLALAGYYILFGRGERRYPLKAAVIAASAVGTYFGVRAIVLHGAMGYEQTSGVTPSHIAENWQASGWVVVTGLTAGALLPFLWLGWKETAPSLKRMALYLLVVLLASNLVFSWLNETRNYMPLVFVLSVVAAGYLTRVSDAATVAEPEMVAASVGRNRR